MNWTHAFVIGALVTAIIGSSIVPSCYRPELFHHFDAADHVIGYFALSAPVAYLIRGQPILVLLILLAGLAVSLEVLQALIPSRDASWRDLTSSFAGILLGVAAGRLAIWIRDRRVSA